MLDKDFSYDHLNDLFTTEGTPPLSNGRPKLRYDNPMYLEDYTATRSGLAPDFIVLERIGEKKPNGGRILRSTKPTSSEVKFHITLVEDDYKFDNSQPNNNDPRTYYKKGWDIVQNILKEEGVKKFKVADAGVRMSESKVANETTKEIVEGTQRGKDITIYTNNNSDYTPQDWIGILGRITQELVDNNIPPGYKQCSDPKESDRPDSYLEGNNYCSYRYEKGRHRQEDFYQTQEAKDSFKWPDNQQPNLAWPPQLGNNLGNNDDNCCNPCKPCTIL